MVAKAFEERITQAKIMSPPALRKRAIVGPWFSKKRLHPSSTCSPTKSSMRRSKFITGCHKDSVRQSSLRISPKQKNSLHTREAIVALRTSTSAQVEPRSEEHSAARKRPEVAARVAAMPGGHICADKP